MKQENEDFDFIKEKNDDKENYLLQKDPLTKYAVFIIGAVLVILVIAFIFLY